MTPKQPTPQTPPKTEPFDTASFGAGATPSAGGATARLRLEPGEKPLPEYVLVRELGSGGFGQVWLAQGPGGFEVALKFLKLGEAAGETELKAMQMMKGIRHANLLDLFGVWEKDGWLIVAMALADRSLQNRLQEAVQQGHVGIPRDELLEYMREAAKGLDFLASKDMVHRDIKPHNLFLSGDSVKVADYGLAKVLEKSLATASTKMTPAYAAPEFFNSKVSKWSDQYSLAVTYCQLRGNCLPFTGDVSALVAGHLLREPDLTMLPPEERPIVAKALAKEPGQRWPSCKAFLEALTLASGQAQPATPALAATASWPQVSPSEELRPPQATSGKGIGIAVLAGALLLLVTAVIGWPWLTTPAATSTSAGEKEPAVKPDLPRELGTSRPNLAADKAREHQQQWADFLELKTELVNSLGMRFRLIPPGEFDMGSPTTEAHRKDDEHQHRVRITTPFYLGIHEVTQEQYERVMGNNPSNFKGPNLPVELVTWGDAQAFIKKLNEREKDTGSVYRLPTEAEWEYACRAGTTTTFHGGDSLDATQVNFGEHQQKTTPVGTFKPNAFGLSDMHGNVWEWCQDGYKDDYYKDSPTDDPVNGQVNTVRVLRGGAWLNTARSCRCAAREKQVPGFCGTGLGFRVVCVPARTP